jgi:hypothetical protein
MTVEMIANQQELPPSSRLVFKSSSALRTAVHLTIPNQRINHFDPLVSFEPAVSIRHLLMCVHVNHGEYAPTGTPIS